MDSDHDDARTVRDHLWRPGYTESDLGHERECLDIGRVYQLIRALVSLGVIAFLELNMIS